MGPRLGDPSTKLDAALKADPDIDATFQVCDLDNGRGGIVIDDLLDQLRTAVRSR